MREREVGRGAVDYRVFGAAAERCRRMLISVSAGACKITAHYSIIADTKRNEIEGSVARGLSTGCETSAAGKKREYYQVENR
jgi:hypothetical protein